MADACNPAPQDKVLHEANRSHSNVDKLEEIFNRFWTTLEERTRLETASRVPLTGEWKLRGVRPAEHSIGNLTHKIAVNSALRLPGPGATRVPTARHQPRRRRRRKSPRKADRIFRISQDGKRLDSIKYRVCGTEMMAPRSTRAQGGSLPESSHITHAWAHPGLHMPEGQEPSRVIG
ncbi:Hypothetical predicted protein [Pelobates cultripes]|uniref:Uncharacterized protein n=1 Tax=Pelobates cultripes TaxID=61616 RepID=A0AAD1S6F2_PELCU|nr:Hypothetical predicted protein [Pelobates cultripes]